MLSKKTTRREEIYIYLKNNISYFQEGIDTKNIADFTGYSRENVSRELNFLVKEGKVEKIKGRPVKYLPLSNKKERKLLKNVIKTNKEIPVLEKLIGYNGSLENNIKQAKAAILYPPNGLHTLLYGPTGVGKTTFAKAMYEYALSIKKFTKENPFIIYNCADYSGNNQLLMSHLFGHTKGAFTGAEVEKEGLVETANNGILFLDEVHRLPPEGQEMLFTIIDTGEYRRLGESNNVRKTNLLLIAATTEEPKSNLLSTFLRRIPSVIKFSNLSEKPLSERINFIRYFFFKESLTVEAPICVPKEIIKMLLTYDCLGNIGQLKNDIQMLCASAFVDYMLDELNYLTVKMSHISNNYEQFFSSSRNESEEIDNIMLKYDKSSIIFDYKNQKSTLNILEKYEDETENNFYSTMMEKSNEFYNKGLSYSEIKKNFNNQIQLFFDSDKELKSKEALVKIVPKKTIEIIDKVIKETSHEFDFEYNKSIIYGMSLHVDSLIKRLNDGEINNISNEKHKKLKDHKLQKIAESIKKKLETEFNTLIPQNEVSLIALLLSTVSTISSLSSYNKVGIIVIMHGQYAATDIANTANQFLGTAHAKSMNMPLDESISSVLEKTIALAKKVHEGKGILLLVDMGSLVNFGEIISEKLNIKVETIEMVSTPMVIEATRKALNSETTLESIKQFVVLNSKLIGNNIQFNNEVETTITPINNFNKEKVREVLGETVNFIDINKIYDQLLEISDNIEGKLNINEFEAFRIKFLFHTVSMLERAITGNTFEYSNNNYTFSKEVINMLIEELEIIEQILGIKIPISELYYIAEIIEVHV